MLKSFWISCYWKFPRSRRGLETVGMLLTSPLALLLTDQPHLLVLMNCICTLIPVVGFWRRCRKVCSSQSLECQASSKLPNLGNTHPTIPGVLLVLMEIWVQSGRWCHGTLDFAKYKSVSSYMCLTWDRSFVIWDTAIFSLVLNLYGQEDYL